LNRWRGGGRTASGGEPLRLPRARIARQGGASRLVCKQALVPRMRISPRQPGAHMHQTSARMCTEVHTYASEGRQSTYRQVEAADKCPLRQVHTCAHMCTHVQVKAGSALSALGSRQVPYPTSARSIQVPYPRQISTSLRLPKVHVHLDLCVFGNDRPGQEEMARRWDQVVVKVKTSS